MNLVDVDKLNELDKPIFREIVKILDYFEQRLDAQEQIMAKIILSYPEMFATIQAIIQTIVVPLSEEDQEQFIALIEKYRNDSLQKMTDAAEEMERNNSGAGSHNEDATPTNQP